MGADLVIIMKHDGVQSMEGDREIYMDYAATTPLAPDVFAAMEPWLTTSFGNPSSPYRSARRARAAVDDAREQVAEIIGAQAKEVYFTSGGTEAANLALLGRAFAPRQEGTPVVVSAIEHQAVLQTARFLHEKGWPKRVVPVRQDGVINMEAWREALQTSPNVAALMYANNEIGTVQPIIEAAAAARNHGVPLFVDAVQAAGLLPLKVDDLGADLLALSAHKFYGPKGVGVLYVRSGTEIVPHLHGGGQERGLRGGTENVAAIVGCAAALARVDSDREAVSTRLQALRDRLWNGIRKQVSDAVLNGDEVKRLPDNVSVRFAGVDGESLLLNLDREGLAASSGSACTSGSLRASHVLLALGLRDDEARSSVRLTIGKQTTEADVDRAIAIIAQQVTRLRERTQLATRFAPGKR